MKRIPIPYMNGEYVKIYAPGRDVYLGPDTANLKYGESYGNWTVNDFSVATADGKWYLSGITHPSPAFLSPDGIDFDRETVHEGENQLFLAENEGGLFSEIVEKAKRGELFRDKKKILRPFERPDERIACHAPHLLKTEDGWSVVYGPDEIRAAQCDGDFNLKDRKVLFTDEPGTRDPFILYDGGVWYLYYCYYDCVAMRKSEDFVNWSDRIIVNHNTFNGSPESPFVMKRGDFYYLFWAIYDGRNGAYDWRTFVFASETPEDFMYAAPVAILPAHAPEIVSDESGDWILSVFYPENGVSAAPLRWE